MPDTQGRRKYFIKVSGSWCYNREGLGFPKKVPLDFEGAIKDVFPDAETRWECYLGWCNQPEVIVFEVSEQVMRNDLNRLIKSFDAPIEAAGLYNRFFTSEYWGYDDGGTGEWGSTYEEEEEDTFDEEEDTFDEED